MGHFKTFTAISMLGLVLGTNVAAAAVVEVSYFGRWTISDPNPDYSSKGAMYKTIDIIVCGKDFCGVSVDDSVDDKGTCGPTLFRFFGFRTTQDRLAGHGLWGKIKKKLEINYVPATSGNEPYFMLALGDDDMDITGREGSVPTFNANYRFVGDAQCSVDHTT